MISKILHQFDKLEDRVRGYLSNYPIIYALIGGLGIVLFWRGVWITADYFAGDKLGTIWDGPFTTLISIIILLTTGIFVASFIGEQIIISGLKGEKKLIEKTKTELEASESAVAKILIKLEKIESRLEEIEKKNT